VEGVAPGSMVACPCCGNNLIVPKNNLNKILILGGIGCLGIILLFVLIIGAAVMLPALSSAKDKAKTANCANNMKQISLGLLMYAQDNKDMLPPVQGADGLQLLRTGENQYLSFSDVYACPATNKKYIYIGFYAGDFFSNGSLPMLVEYPAHGKNRVNVAFVDGHVESRTLPSDGSVRTLVKMLLDDAGYRGQDADAVLDKLSEKYGI
jgi:prepilin-type processing-associated H-X9-DG protein